MCVLWNSGKDSALGNFHGTCPKDLRHVALQAQRNLFFLFWDLFTKLVHPVSRAAPTLKDQIPMWTLFLRWLPPLSSPSTLAMVPCHPSWKERKQSSNCVTWQYLNITLNRNLESTWAEDRAGLARFITETDPAGSLLCDEVLSLFFLPPLLLKPTLWFSLLRYLAKIPKQSSHYQILFHGP